MEVPGLLPAWGGMIPPPDDTRGAEAVGASALSSSPVAGEKTNYPPDQGEFGSARYFCLYDNGRSEGVTLRKLLLARHGKGYKKVKDETYTELLESGRPWDHGA